MLLWLFSAYGHVLIDTFVSCCSAFKGIQGMYEDTYSYNPCYPFTENSCKNVAVSIIYIYHISLINSYTWLFSHQKSKRFVPKIFNNITVQYYSRGRYYLYTYMQLYIISFLFFNNLVIVSRVTLIYC